ncbi:MAG TPA: DUF1801 domain-containing protein [Candidatus Saccharimonadales bacterium]|nr:DUF1801 domain-containing protein [Candidatus Saccharimonadales bacterium]
MKTIPEVDSYITSLPQWQQAICQKVRLLIHQADAGIAEEIKFKDRPYFTLQGNVCALLAAKDHVNVFIYDPIAPDPSGIINQGLGNTTARSIQLYEGNLLDDKAFIELIKAIAANNRKGGWRKL